MEHIKTGNNYCDAAMFCVCMYITFANIVSAYTASQRLQQLQNL